MRVAIPVWQGRVSPVFDVARTLILMDIGDGQVTRQAETPLLENGLAARAKRVAELDVQVLVCGAISRPLEAALSAAGVQVIAYTCGPVQQVLEAFISGRLDQEIFVMPGCCRWRQRMRGRDRQRTAWVGRARGRQSGP